MAPFPLVISLLFIVFIKFEVETAKSGPYTVDFQKIEPCEDQGTKEVVWYNLTKLENGNFNIQLYLGITMDKNLKICVTGREITSDGSTKIHKFNCKTCSEAWLFLGDFFSSLMVAAGQEPEVCGFLKGNYSATNWNANQPFRLVPIMNYNSFIFESINYVENVKVGCHRFYVKFGPK